MSQQNTVSFFAWSLPEETANQWTHGLGLLLSLPAAAVILLSANPDVFTFTGCLVYAAALVAVFAASTLSHSFSCPVRREFYRMLDQVCIFLMIAGGITPFILVHVRNTRGWVLLGIMWAVAIAGCAVRMRSPGQTLAAIPFLILGWIPVLLISDFYQVGQWGGLSLVLAGGILYSIGAIFLIQDHRAPWFHPVWHLHVIAASACHYFFLLEYVARYPLLGNRFQEVAGG